MRYRLRTLLIVLALGPPMLAGGWLAANELYQQSLPNYKEPIAVWTLHLKPPQPNWLNWLSGTP